MIKIASNEPKKHSRLWVNVRLLIISLPSPFSWWIVEEIGRSGKREKLKKVENEGDFPRDSWLFTFSLTAWIFTSRFCTHDASLVHKNLRYTFVYFFNFFPNKTMCTLSLLQFDRSLAHTWHWNSNFCGCSDFLMNISEWVDGERKLHCIFMYDIFDFN